MHLRIFGVSLALTLAASAAISRPINRLEDVPNVSAPTKSPGDALIWNGSKWVNASFAASLTNVDQVRLNREVAASGEMGTLGASGGFVVGGGLWNLKGVAIRGQEAGDHKYAAEANVLYDSGIFKAWASVGGSFAPAIAYWTSSDGQTFTRQAGTVLSGYQRSWVMKDTNFLASQPFKLYGLKMASQQAIDLYTSTNGLAWNLYFPNLITVSGATNLGNIAVLHDTNCTVTGYPADVWVAYYDLCDSPGVTWWYDRFAVSTNGTNFTDRTRIAGQAILGRNWIVSDQTNGMLAVGLEARPDMGGLWIAKQTRPSIGGAYFAYGHAAWPQPGTPVLPSDIYRLTSLDFTNWTSMDQRGAQRPELLRSSGDDGAFSGAGQVADAFLVEAGGKTYLYYDSIPTQSFGTDEAKLKVAVADTSISNVLNWIYAPQAVLSGEFTGWGKLRLGNPSTAISYRGLGSSGEVLLVGPTPGISFYDTSTLTPLGAFLEYANGTFSYTLTNGYAQWLFNNQAAGAKHYSFSSLGTGTGNAGTFSFNDTDTGASRWAVDSIGRHGVGLINPAAQLHVWTTNTLSMRIESADVSTYPLAYEILAHRTNNANLVANDTYALARGVGAAGGLWKTNAEIDVVFKGDGSTNGADLVFYVQDRERMRLPSTGGLVLSDTDPTAATRLPSLVVTNNIQAGPTNATATNGIFATLYRSSFTVANLFTPPASSFPVVYCSDAVTAAGTGSTVWWNGSAWQTKEGVTATTDVLAYILGTRAVGLCANSPISAILLSPVNYQQWGALKRNFSQDGTGASSGGYGVSVLGSYTGFSSGTTAVGDGRGYGELWPAMVAGGYLSTGGQYAVGNLCSSAERYACWLGLMNSNATNWTTEGSVFLYDMYGALQTTIGSLNYTNVASAASNNWIAVSVKASSYTAVDTGLPVKAGTTAADNLVIIAATDHVRFYTNGVLSVDVSTASKIPTQSLYSNAAILLKTGTGTTSRSLYEWAPGYHARFASRSW
jgi:hypothetical protein